MAVVLTFAGDSNDAVAAIAKLERKYSDLENKIKNIGPVSKKSGTDVASSFANIAQSITGIGSATQLASKGVEILIKSFEDLKEVQGRAAGSQVDFGKAFTEMALNAPVGADPVKLKNDLLNLSARTSIMPVDLARIQNTAQASKGSLSDDRVVDTIVEAAKISKLAPEAMEALIGISLDIQKQNPDKYTPRKTIAFALNQAAESHVKNASDYATNVMPGVAAIAKLDNTSLDFPAAAANAVTQSSGDPMGRKTRTALLAMHFQLERALPDLKSFQERVEYAQNDPEFTNAFFTGTKHKGKSLPSQDMEVSGPDGEKFQFSGNKASFETQSLPFMKMLLQKDSVVANDTRRLMASVPTLENSEPSFKQREAGMKADPNMQNAETAQRFKVASDIKKLQNIPGGKSGIVRKSLDELMGDSGIGYVDRFMFQRRVQSQFGKSHDEATIASLAADRDYHKRLADMEDKWGDNPTHQELAMQQRSKQTEYQGFIDLINRGDVTDVAKPGAPGMNGNNEIGKLAVAIEKNTKVVEENNKLLAEPKTKEEAIAQQDSRNAEFRNRRNGTVIPKGNVE